MLTHYRAKQVNVDRRRHYQVEGQCFPGVTTILSATKSRAEKQRLQQWRSRIGSEAANQITAQASRAGTKIHGVLKSYLRQEDWTLPEGTEALWRSLEPVLEQVEQVLLVEGAVWHPLKFAGYPDALMVYDGRLVVCDWKTARRPKQLEWIEDYCLQIAAYSWAINWVYRNDDIHVHHGLIAIALQDAPAQVFEIAPEELDLYWQRFQQRLLQYYRQQSWRG